MSSTDVYVTDVQISDKVHSAGGFDINHYFHRKLTLQSAPLRTSATVVPIQKSSEGRPGQDGRSFLKITHLYVPKPVGKEVNKPGKLTQ